MKLRPRFESSNGFLSDWLEVYLDGRIGEELVKAVKDGDAKRIVYVRTKFLRTEVRTIARVMAGRCLSDHPKDNVEYYVEWRSQEKVRGTDRFVSAARIEREVNILIAALRWLSKAMASSVDDVDIDHRFVIQTLAKVYARPAVCADDTAQEAADTDLDAGDTPVDGVGHGHYLAGIFLRRIIEPIRRLWQ